MFQCGNGHTACAGCCKKLTTKKCPSCLLPIGTNRCIILEKIIESLQIQCKYFVHGCKKMLPYIKRNRGDHEDVCKYRPFQCPVVGCNREVPKSGLPNHFLNNHNGEIVYYEKPDEEDPADEMKNSFTISTDDVAYDRHRSQYVIVQVCGGSEDSEEQESDEQDSEDQLFLVHHQYHERQCRYSFSLTAFGTYIFEYRLSVDFDREPPRPGIYRRTFKSNHSIEGPVHDNQTDKGFLNAVVRQGDCLFVPKVPTSQKDGLKFEVQFQITSL